MCLEKNRDEISPLPLTPTFWVTLGGVEPPKGGDSTFLVKL
jgi:hypothetical protein